MPAIQMPTEAQLAAVRDAIHRELGNLGRLSLVFNHIRLTLDIRWEYLGCYIEFCHTARLYDVDVLATICNYAVETIRRESRRQIVGTTTSQRTLVHV
ncbi:MAG: hypothetical protein AMXMBFR16_11210 [Candidatus Uhrbacteria bacterium]